VKQIDKEILFKRPERLALISILLLVVISYAYTLLIKPKMSSQTSIYAIDEVIKYEPEIDTTIKQIKKLIEPKKKTWNKYKNPEINLQAFDPNKADSLTLLQLGLKPWTVSNIIKYRLKGGQFYDCKDLKKVYSLLPTTYEAILPYCSIVSKKKKTSKDLQAFSAPKKQSAFKPKSNFSKRPTTIIDLNAADTASLKA